MSSKSRNREAKTIEDVFSSVSETKAHGGLAGGKRRVVLTPRSAEACLREGVDPDDIKIRDLDSFWEPGLDPAIQRMRHEAYSMQRHNKMQAARAARQQMIAEQKREKKIKSAKSKLNISEDAGTLVEIERRRLEKLQRKQQQEIEQMMQYEMRMAQTQEEVQRKQQAEAERQEQLEKQRQRRRKEAQELARQKELQKRLLEEEQERERRMLAASQAERVWQNYVECWFSSLLPRIVKLLRNANARQSSCSAR